MEPNSAEAGCAGVGQQILDSVEAECAGVGQQILGSVEEIGPCLWSMVPVSRVRRAALAESSNKWLEE